MSNPTFVRQKNTPIAVFIITQGSIFQIFAMNGGTPLRRRTVAMVTLCRL